MIRDIVHYSAVGFKDTQTEKMMKKSDHHADLMFFHYAMAFKNISG